VPKRGEQHRDSPAHFESYIACRYCRHCRHDLQAPDSTHAQRQPESRPNRLQDRRGKPILWPRISASAQEELRCLGAPQSRL
jgi:hypothetical protein